MRRARTLALLAALLAWMPSALADEAGRAIAETLHADYLSLALMGGSSLGAGHAPFVDVEGTWSPWVVLNLSAGAQHVARANEVYADVGTWFGLSIAAGAGYHGALTNGPSAGPELHLFAGLPLLPLPLRKDEHLLGVVEPMFRLTRFLGSGQPETIAQLGLEFRLATPGPRARERDAKERLEAAPR